MARVSAPYNFVPINDKVFFPPWAPFISNDIPFKDGLSGKIELEITAEGPIFIRGEEQVNERNSDFKQYRFFKRNNKFCIPGSSLKGEISSILEILSFSKLKPINDVKYSQRDWNNGKIYDKSSFTDVKGGWLSKTDSSYKIEYNKDENPGRISHSTIDSKFNNRTNFCLNFSDRGYRNNDNHKAAKKKYDLFSNREKTHNFLEKQYSSLEYVSEYSFNDGGDKRGTLVFTGQPGKRAQQTTRDGSLVFRNGSPVMKGKYLEFIFWEPNEETILNENDIRIKSFKTSYFDNSTSESIDWKYYKQKLLSGDKIPIFITLDSEEKIEHFGLSMLYKLPYKNSISDLLTEDHKDENLDFKECLFGSIDEKKVKGRVQFGHLFSNNAKEQEQFTAILASPKPSFYPYYVKQNFLDNSLIIENNYNTYNDGEIAGRKRYPITNFENELLRDQVPSKSTTTFFPLEKGSVFDGTISFHNLLPQELGALLSALTFHYQNSEYYRHSIGQARSLGLGRIRIKVKTLTVENKPEKIENYICAFEKLMVNFNSNWLKSEQLEELLAMSKPVSHLEVLNADDLDRKLYYHPKLNIAVRNGDDFQNIKKEDLALPRYSKYLSLDVDIKPVLKENSYNKETDLTIFKKKKIIWDKLKKLDKYINEVKKELKSKKKELVQKQINSSKVPEIKGNNIKLGLEAKALLDSIKNKRATLNLDGTNTTINIVFDKWVDKTKLTENEIIDVKIHQIKKDGTINSVKYIEN